MSWTIVDLGAKKGGSLDVARKMHKAVFGGPADLSPSKCLAVDRNDKYAPYLIQKGYAFTLADVMDKNFIWPEAMYYTAWDFLEHMPSIESSDYVLRNMLLNATHGVWLRMPCFETQHVERLRSLGLRYTWDGWSCHRSRYTTAHADAVLATVHGFRALKHRWVNSIGKSEHKHLVPVGAPLDATEYLPEHGERPKVQIQPPVPSAIDYVACKVRVPCQIEKWEDTYARLVSDLESGKSVTFNRFGDGEWHAMLAFDEEWAGRFTENKRVSCGMHGTHPELANALKRVISGNPTYTFGMQPLVFRVMGDAASEWLRRHRIDRKWANGDALHDASRAGKIGPFIAACRKRRIVMVGPDHLSKVATALGASHVLTPSQDAWYTIGEIMARCRAALDGAEPSVMMVSVGPVSKVMIDELYRQYGHVHSLVDTGAMWDVYAGVKSRKYHDSVDLNQLVVK